VSRATSIKQPSHDEKLAELEAQVKALRQQLHRAQQLATVGTMTAMVAHEFNNILTPIINYAQLAQKNPSLVNKALTRAAEGGARATDICRALLGVTQPHNDTQREICLIALVRQALQAMARQPEKDRIELQICIPEDLTITTRPVELQQVLMNLLINARSAVLAAAGPSEIEISAEKKQDCTVICVSDNGLGISPENLKRIFEPFFSTKDAPDGESQGYGLGLAFCQEIVSDLGGSISTESALSEGTTFTLRLPEEQK